MACEPQVSFAPRPRASHLVTSWGHRTPSFCGMSRLLWVNNAGNSHQKLLLRKGQWAGPMVGGFPPCRRWGGLLGLADDAAQGLGGLETVSPGCFPRELSGGWVSSHPVGVGPQTGRLHVNVEQKVAQPPQTTCSAWGGRRQVDTPQCPSRPSLPRDPPDHGGHCHSGTPCAAGWH